MVRGTGTEGLGSTPGSVLPLDSCGVAREVSGPEFLLMRWGSRASIAQHSVLVGVSKLLETFPFLSPLCSHLQIIVVSYCFQTVLQLSVLERAQDCVLASVASIWFSSSVCLLFTVTLCRSLHLSKPWILLLFFFLSYFIVVQI